MFCTSKQCCSSWFRQKKPDSGKIQFWPLSLKWFQLNLFYFILEYSFGVEVKIVQGNTTIMGHFTLMGKTSQALIRFRGILFENDTILSLLSNGNRNKCIIWKWEKGIFWNPLENEKFPIIFHHGQYIVLIYDRDLVTKKGKILKKYPKSIKNDFFDYTQFPRPSNIIEIGQGYFFLSIHFFQ